MKWIRKLFSLLLISVFAVLLLAPVGLLFLISKEEILSYARAEDIILRELSYGKAEEIAYRTMAKSITVDGIVVSTKVDFIELKDADKIRLVVSCGDYLSEDSVIGYLAGKEICAGKTGVVREINTGIDGYIMINRLDALAIECYVDHTEMDWEPGKELRSEDGTVFTVLSVDAINTPSLGTRVLLASETAALKYGEQIQSMPLETSITYTNVLTVRKNCVYSYPGSSKTYVRLVNCDGEIEGEAEVHIGYSDDSYVCVSGELIEAGMLCDSGYKFVVEGATSDE